MRARSQVSANRHFTTFGRLNLHHHHSPSSQFHLNQPHLYVTTVKLLLRLQTLIYQWEEWMARVLKSHRIDVVPAGDQCVGCVPSLRLVLGGNACNAGLRAERNG